MAEQTTSQEYPFETLSNEKLRKFVINFASDFNLYPGFTFVPKNPKYAWYTRWGEIIVDNDEILLKSNNLPSFTTYLIMNGLMYHALIPGTEFNRLTILLAAQHEIRDLPQDVYGFLVSIFSLLHNIGILGQKRYWYNLLRNIFMNIREEIRISSPLAKFFSNLLSELLQIEDNHLNRFTSILQSNLPLYVKARLFFNQMKKFLGALKPWSFHERHLRKLIIPLTFSDIMLSNDTKHVLSASELEQIAELDYDFAKKLAKKLDKRIPLKTAVYSDKRNMLQKLLRERRYLAAARRARIRIIQSLLETKLLSVTPSLTRYGFSEWYLGDDEENLDIEISLDAYGRVIPNYSSLKDLYTPSGPIIGRQKYGHIELCIDTSGSMSGEPLDIAVEISIALLYIAKKFGLSISLTTFSSGAWEGFSPTRDYDSVEEILLRLDSEGGTNIRHVFEIIYSHITMTRYRPLTVFITDSHIYDIEFPNVLSYLQDILSHSDTLFVVIGEEIWEKTLRSLQSLNIPTILVNPKMSVLEYFDSFLKLIGRGVSNASKLV